MKRKNMMDIIEDYPKEVILKDNKKLLLRPLGKNDFEALYDFFQSISDEERIFLRHDIKNKKVIKKWIDELNYEKVFPMIAEHENKIIADSTLHFSPYPWERHVGEIRFLLAKDYHSRGLATALIRELVYVAKEAGLELLETQLMETQKLTISIFEKEGFTRQAEIKDRAIDINGIKHNVIILTSETTSLWNKLQEHIEELDLRLFRLM